MNTIAITSYQLSVFSCLFSVSSQSVYQLTGKPKTGRLKSDPFDYTQGHPEESRMDENRTLKTDNRNIMLQKLTIITALVVLFLYSFIYSVEAAIVKKDTVSVSAVVGEFTLSVSGFVSPFASVVLTTKDGTVLRSGVADANGNFFISEVLIHRGFSGFCLIAVDFKRVGESTTCIDVPPATGSIVMKNIFLPPTLGLLRKEIVPGTAAVAFGYTMPGATVTMHLSNGKTLTTTADATGYYEFHIENLQAGEYELYATASYQGKQSLTPSKKIILKALNVGQQARSKLRDFEQNLISLLPPGLGILWLAVPILILIIILLYKLSGIHIKRPQLFPKKLHHAWFVGY